METIRLITCNTIQEANIIKGRLINEGIPAFTTNENTTTLLPHLNGMLGAGSQVCIDKEFYNQAIDIINETKSSVHCCPFCGSANITYNLGAHKPKKLIAIILSILVSIPFGNIKSTSYCKDCHSEF